MVTNFLGDFFSFYWLVILSRLITYFREHFYSYIDLLWGLGGGLTIYLINYLLIDNLDKEDITSIYLAIFSKGNLEVIFFLFSAIIIAPFLEELFFRVYLFRKIRDKFDLFWGYLGSTLLFVLAHALLNRSGLPLLAIYSIMITYIYQKTGSLRAIFISHSLWNFSWYASILGKI